LNQREYSPLEIVRGLISRWPWLVIGMLVGGMLGLVLGFSQPPVYEASAFLQVSVDHNRAVIPDDYTLLRAFDKVRLIFLADDTINQVLEAYSIEAANANSIQSVADFRSSIKLTQRPEGFQLFVYSGSPTDASNLANLWGEVALSEIEEASKHALRAADYQSALYGAWCQMATREVGAESQSIWSCHFGEDQINPDELADDILEEVQKSRGIIPVFSFSWIEKSSPPEKPITFTSGWSVLSGALLGLIISSAYQVYRYLLPESKAGIA